MWSTRLDETSGVIWPRPAKLSTKCANLLLIPLTFSKVICDIRRMCEFCHLFCGGKWDLGYTLSDHRGGSTQRFIGTTTYNLVIRERGRRATIRNSVFCACMCQKCEIVEFTHQLTCCLFNPLITTSTYMQVKDTSSRDMRDRRDARIHDTLVESDQLCKAWQRSLTCIHLNLSLLMNERLFSHSSRIILLLWRLSLLTAKILIYRHPWNPSK